MSSIVTCRSALYVHSVIAHCGCMRNEEFYTTAAQVLPALIIALIVEFTFVLGDMIKEYMRRTSDLAHATLWSPEAFPPEQRPSVAAEERRAVRAFRRVSYPRLLLTLGGLVVGISFLLGELASLLV